MVIHEPEVVPDLLVRAQRVDHDPRVDTNGALI
jgi:hypothetical protein